MKQLGYNEKMAARGGANININELARVLVEHRERYVVQSEEGTFQAEITGNIRFAAQSRADFPAVGDWVRITKMDEQTAIILEVLPRYSMLSRQAVGRNAEVQLIGANIDVAFIVQAVGHDFNLNRIERYLSICYAGEVEPAFILTKADLATESELEGLKNQIKERIPEVQFVVLSSENGLGYEELETMMQAGLTYCFVGSSGVGKSTIINRLLPEEKMRTAAISESTAKGRHTTSHRELFVLANGSIVIDTPGMRELGMTDDGGGIERTYDRIAELAASCRYADCTHSSEKGCAVIAAVDNGELSEAAYENYLKLKREQEHFSSSVHERRQKEKGFGKMIKSVVKDRKKNKF